MPPISFNSIPDNIRVPLAYIEIDNSRANAGSADAPVVLMLGQRLTTGTVAANIPTQATSAEHAEVATGRGSMLHNMFTAFKKANRTLETWFIALDDDGAGVAATKPLTVTGTATTSGSLYAYIGGNRVKAGVAIGDDADTIATALANAISADTSLEVTAAVNGGTSNQVDVTCKWAGASGNDIDIRFNYYTGEAFPGGVSVTGAGNMSGGANNPDIASAIAAMGDMQYDAIVMPYTDAANLALLEAELLDRFGPLRMIGGLMYTAFRGTHGATTTFGNGRNLHLASCQGTSTSPTPPYIWASVNAAIATNALAIDPARPLQTLALPGVLPAAANARFTWTERNLLLHDGISTHSIDRDGTVRIERQITMYQTNAQSVADASYLDINTPATVSYVRKKTRQRILLKFPRHKLGDNGNVFGSGQPVVTPNIIRDELIALFRELESDGLLENFDQYKNDLVVERDQNDRTRVNVLGSPDLINQFRVFAAQIQFIL